MFKCEICNHEYTNKSNFSKHIKKCEKMDKIKDDIIKLYVDELYSIRELRKKFKIQSEDIKTILGDKVRSYSQSMKINRKKCPEKYRHTKESKKKLREKRLEFIKNNPDKTAWRLSNVSYPEKLFIEYIEQNGLNKKYSIIREYSIFPYFIDFAFINEKVAIEIDGSQHLLPERKKSDNDKDKLLNNLGWSVIRISENEVKVNIDNVFKNILSILKYKPKVSNFKIGLVVKPKKHQKKERNEFGFTESQIHSFISQRKVERPPLNELKKIIAENGYKKTGEIFNVSDNSIRKWLKSYEKGL